MSSSSLSLTASQVQCLQGLLSSSAILSIAGSSLICYQVVVGKKYDQTLHRLLLGLSIADIVTSTRLAVLPPLRYPFEAPGAACTADGFLTVLGYAGPYYNVALSFYYLLTIRCGVREDTMKKRYEPLFHGVSIAYAATTSIAGLAIEAYNPSPFGLGCWINSYPSDCTGEDCERGQRAALFGLIAAVLPLLGVLISLIVNTGLVYRYVRRQELQTQQHSLRATTCTRPASSSIPITPDSEGNEQGTNKNNKQQKQKRTYNGPQLSQKVAVQSFLYVGAFFGSFIFSLVLLIVSSIDPEGVQTGQYFGLQALEAFLYPLQGFFNFGVYLRPRYLKWRRVAGNETSRLYCFRQAAFSTQPPTPTLKPPTPSPQNNPTKSSGAMTHPEDLESSSARQLALSGGAVPEANTTTTAKPIQQSRTDTNTGAQMEETGTA